MKKFILTLPLLILIGLFFSTQVFAKPDFLGAQITNPQTGDIKNSVVIPSRAIEVAPNIFYLGVATDNGRPVQGYAYIHYKQGYGKPSTACGNGLCEPGENANKCPVDCSEDSKPDSSCYGFLASGAKWKTIEPYIVNPANNSNLDPEFIVNNLKTAISEWETAAATDIVGNASSTSSTLVADLISPDNQNEVYFGSIQEPGAIAITIIWGYFRGRPITRELLEWDQVYDQVDYSWSSSGEADKMDFANIATHELGHTVGLDDLYTSSCAEETMYGYADYGETQKQTLEAGDIAGVSQLYQ